VTEALAATLMAYEADRNERWLAWHRRVMDWALARYPVLEHGEWRQRLTREGNPMTEFIALPVKDPFHLPRGLIVGIETLARLAGDGGLPGKAPG
jgi:N-acylglucosamine 2-epimerase